MFSALFAPSMARPYLPPVVSFLPSETSSDHVVGGFAMFELKSKEEAIEGATRFMELHKKYWPGWEGETEIRQVLGPEAFEQKA